MEREECSQVSEHSRAFLTDLSSISALISVFGNLSPVPTVASTTQDRSTTEYITFHRLELIRSLGEYSAQCVPVPTH